MKTLLCLSAFFLVFLVNCNVTDSGNDLTLGNRSYTWSVDTLYSPPGGWVYNIWGSNPDDVWAVVGTGNETLWRFDGIEWEPWPERVASGLYSIFGFDEDNVWAGGQNGLMYHFDGETWELSYKYEKENYSIEGINDIWGLSPTNFYAIGTAYSPSDNMQIHGFLIHYNGSNWTELYFAEYDIQFQRLRGNHNDLFIRGTKLDYSGVTPDTVIIYKYNSGKINEFLSRTSDQPGSLDLNTIDYGVLILEGFNVYRVEQSSLESVLHLNEDTLVYGVSGRSSSDLFINTINGMYHYNGVNKKPLLQIPNDMPNNVFRNLIFKEEIFFSVIDFNSGTNLIFQGTLNDKE
ncbi:MAG: hypothetical protein WD267_06005 [Balneolales bacterium]